jgi:CHAT domain-containing protein
MDKSYDSISEVKTATGAPELQRIVTKARPNDVLMVSSDKWMSKHPMDFHLGSKVVRSVNFFTAESSVKLNKLNVTGFFNPLLAGGVASLPGADKEAVSIKSIIPTASIIRHEGATLGALQQAESANVIHLSMHGQFNPEDATQSKLFFAGAKFDGSVGDSKALYAADMSKVAALSNRDLIFAAACQTGLSAADRSNENELIGMLRPLTANRNRNVILSLWSVSDEVAGEFVQAFYQRLAATQEITTSFHFAQDQIKAKHPHPFYWAAFYLSQAK